MKTKVIWISLLITIFIISKLIIYLLIGKHAELIIPGWHTTVYNAKWISNCVGLMAVLASLFLLVANKIINDKLNC